jgi:hypothetical protein
MADTTNAGDGGPDGTMADPISRAARDVLDFCRVAGSTRGASMGAKPFPI